jgi:4'-phosphopantetheinyl transferase EntD
MTAERIANQTAEHGFGLAIPSRLLAKLFPQGVVGAVLREPGEPALLWPEERGYVADAVPKRQREFAAGRLCARAALAAFGIADAPLLMNGDRSPKWPGGMIGSITHTEGFCAAAAADQKRVSALGIDAEVIGRVTQMLWDMICTPDELLWLDGLSESERSRAATLIFAAKEAVYKCLYPINGERLDFHDVSIAPEQGDLGDTCFAIRPLRRLQLPDRSLKQLKGRFLFTDNIVLAGVAIAE